MSIFSFRKNKGDRTNMAIAVLSLMLFAVTAALVVGGVSVTYMHRQKQDTAAYLTAADLLSLQTAYENNDAAAEAVLRALISCRSSGFLSAKETETLNKLIDAGDGFFADFCSQIRSGIEKGRFSAKTFVKTLKSCTDKKTSGTLGRATTINRRAPLHQVLFGIGADQRASEHFSMIDIFEAEGNCAYCKNVYIEFSGKSSRVCKLSVENTVTQVLLSEDECVSLAKDYAQGRCGFPVYGTGYVLLKNGVYFVSILDKNGAQATVGVRGDTGGIVFFLL